MSFNQVDSRESFVFVVCFFLCVSLYQRLTGGVESRCSVARKQRRVCCSFSPSETRGRLNTQNTHLPSSSCDLEQMNTDVLARLFRFHSRTLSTLLHFLGSSPPPRLSSTSSASSPSASSQASVFNLKSVCPSAPTASSQTPFSCGWAHEGPFLRGRAHHHHHHHNNLSPLTRVWTL